ncbi:hypothetical protein DYB31_010609, partial [Aphanomyces astaci]
MPATYQQILDAIRRVEAGESKAAVVRSSAISRATLFHYIKMKKDTGAISINKRGPHQALPSSIEQDLVAWIAAMQRPGMPVERGEVIHKANAILAVYHGVPRNVTRGWYYKFCVRNPIIADRVDQKLSKSRNAVNKE